MQCLHSPADASAYFVPANVRNGRLFAGAHAPRPRFLPLFAGPSFHGSGIGPESFAAERGVEGCVRDKQEAQKPTIAPGSGFQPPHSRLERKKNNRQPACPEREAVKA